MRSIAEMDLGGEVSPDPLCAPRAASPQERSEAEWGLGGEVPPFFGGKAPGLIKTVLTGTLGENEYFVESVKACTPIGHLGWVRDVAGAVFFLFQSPRTTSPAR
ncbi:MAG: hypothetical protein WBB65_12800 [Anaerolineales bacterium]